MNKYRTQKVQSALQYTRYVLILIVAIASSEYAVMTLFAITEVENYLSQEAQAIADSILLIILSAAPVYFWIVKPIVELSKDYQNKLKSLSEALDGASNAVIIMDATGSISYISKAFTFITGYFTDDLIHKNYFMLQSNKHSEIYFERMWSSLSEKGEWESEKWSNRKNGELFREKQQFKSIHDAGGNVKHYIGVISDITKQRQEDMLIQQSQKMEAVGTLAGGIAHNLNNMLTGIIGNVYLAMKISNEPKNIQYLQKINAIGNDAASIIHQLLSFSHQNNPQKKSISIVPLLKDAAETAQLGIREDIEFITELTNETLTVYCDPVEIQQVIINLINNARDSLTTSRPRKLFVSVKRAACEEYLFDDACHAGNADMACLLVEDTGCGIDESVLKRIFEPFFTTKETGKGTGLGLSMAKGVIESHGGSIHVVSTVGAGTKVEIYLPLTNNLADTSENKQEIVHASRKETILVVDDDDVVRTTISQVLLSLGYDVLTAEHGEEGVCIFLDKVDQVSLLVTDVVMPVMDGFTAVEKMRQTRPDLPVIIITGYDDESTGGDSHGDRLTTIANKPIDIATFSHEVHRLLNLNVLDDCNMAQASLSGIDSNLSGQ